MYDEGLLLELEARTQILPVSEARALLGWSQWQWRRRIDAGDFPARVRHGRREFIHPAKLAAYLRDENRRAGGLALHVVAKRVGRSRGTIHKLMAAGQFPSPAYRWHGHERWEPMDITQWERQLLSGLAPNWPVAPPAKHRRRQIRGSGE